MREIDPNTIGRPLKPQHPQRLGRYDLLRVLGIGGMGTVFLGRQEPLKRLVAVKVLGGAAEARADWVQRFNLEIEAMSRLHHPNIVAILDASEHEGQLFYVMEFVDGVPLRKFIGKPQKFQGVIRIAYKVCLALEAVHKAHLIHRDLKPDNILIDRYGEVKLTDFGIVKAVQRPGQEDDGSTPMLTGQGATVGTAAYMAPEQMFGRGQVGPPADVFAFGVMLHEMITGLRPDPELAKVSKLIPGMPAWLDEALDLCLNIDPKRRFQDGGEVKRFLTIHANRVKGEFPTVGLMDGHRERKEGQRKKVPAAQLADGINADEIDFDDDDDDWDSDELEVAEAAPKKGGAKKKKKKSAKKSGGKGKAKSKAKSKKKAGGRKAASSSSSGGGAKKKSSRSAKASSNSKSGRSNAAAEAEDKEEVDDLMTMLAAGKRTRKLELDKTQAGNRPATGAKPQGEEAAPPQGEPAVAVLDDDEIEEEDSDGFLLDIELERQERQQGPSAAGTRPIAKRRGAQYSVKTCSNCKGKGAVRKWFVVKRPCDTCSAAGVVYRLTEELRQLRWFVWGGTGLVVLLLLLFGAMSALRLVTDSPALAWLGIVPLPYVIATAGFAVLALILWGVDLSLQGWRPTDFVPSGCRILPTRPAKLRMLIGLPPAIVSVLVIAALLPGAFAAVEEDDGGGYVQPEDDENAPPSPLPEGLENPESQEESDYWQVTRRRDGMPMVYVPAGPAVIGWNGGLEIEQPQLMVDVPGYYIDRYEVSSAQYAAFLQSIRHRIERHQGSRPERFGEVVHYAYDRQSEGRIAFAFDAEEAIQYGSYPLPHPDMPRRGTSWSAEELPSDLRGGVVWNDEEQKWQARPGQGHYPMIFVTWHGAQAYAEWVGAELPSEIEWEKAARGSAPSERLYPWGDWNDPTTANTASRVYRRTLNDPGDVRQARAQRSDNPIRMLSVERPGGGDISPFGVLHLGGNVRTWCRHPYDPDLYQRIDEDGFDPRSLNVEDGNVPFAIRGAALDDARAEARLTYRRSELRAYASWRLGFRCVIRLNNDDNDDE